MATIRILLGIFCLATFGWGGRIGGSALASREYLVMSREASRSVQIRRAQSPPSLLTALHVLAIARTQLGIREASGKNDGHLVERYLAYTDNQKGDPWCAAFVSWVFGQAGAKQPRTAWSPALFPLTKRTKLIRPAVVFAIYFPQLKRIAHCGFVVKQKSNWIYTIEGNTNVSGIREGDGVYAKIRHKNTISVYADWISKVNKGGQP